MDHVLHIEPDVGIYFSLVVLVPVPVALFLERAFGKPVL